MQLLISNTNRLLYIANTPDEAYRHLDTIRGDVQLTPYGTAAEIAAWTALMRNPANRDEIDECWRLADGATDFYAALLDHVCDDSHDTLTPDEARTEASAHLIWRGSAVEWATDRLHEDYDATPAPIRAAWNRVCAVVAEQAVHDGMIREIYHETLGRFVVVLP